MISAEKINEIISRIVTNYHPDKIILFGSYATGKATEQSDLDLLLIKDDERIPPERAIAVRKFLYGTLVPVDLFVFTNDEFNEAAQEKFTMGYDISKTGKVLYEK